MSNPTTPFSWQMPTATDLVTDLPADFQVFGQAVATSMADLLGGTTGQVLSKTTNADMDFTWVAANPGDITGVTAGVGITGGGTSGTVTVTNDMATTITTNGDLIYGTGSGTYTRRAIGSTGNVLTVSGGIPVWSAPAGGGKVLQVVQGTTSTAASNATTTYADTNLSVTITPTLNTSKILLMFTQNQCVVTNGGNFGLWIQLLRGATTLLQYPSNFWTNTANYFSGQVNGHYLDSPATTSATTYKTQFRNKIAGSYVAVQDDGVAAYASTIIAMEIGA